MPEELTTRRGRKPSTESDHPLGRLVRERRLARNWSIAKLAEEVGIRPTSISLISEIERGRRAPSLEVAEKLAQVLDLPTAPLLDWAETMRRSPRSQAQVRAERSRYETEGLSELADRLRTTPPSWDHFRAGSPDPSIEWAPGPSGSVAVPRPEADDDVPVFPPGTDPDGRAARPAAWMPRRHLPSSLAGSLVRPVAFVVSDEDYERLKRPIYADRRPRFALVTRTPVHTIDPREPYAVRRRGQVKLAYVAWDGREVFILPPPGRPGFDHASAEGPRGLEKRLVGQIVAMLGWSG
jgi:transcriptional regulator with XRE-family HTH domain